MSDTNQNAHESHAHQDHSGQDDGHRNHEAHPAHGRRQLDAAEGAAMLESDTAKRMAEAATTFLATLTPEQRERTVLPVGDEERFNWHYIPKERRGLTFKEMDGAQQKLAHALLSSGLSQQGYSKAVSIMSLEAILAYLEGPDRRQPRDPDLYYVTVFGTPSEREPWGWRVEGHHVSVNFLVVDGDRIAPTPNFFGTNPARVPAGVPNGREGLRVLSSEEDLARHLLLSLDATQRRRALVSPDAPADILTRAERHVKADSPEGVRAGDLTHAQLHTLDDLLEEYIHRMPRDVADVRLDRIEKEGRSHIHFAWAGSERPGQPHYYRVQGPGFLIEYDNTQNNANHIHSVWRDLAGDWGNDLLADHYQRSH
ncbi:MAG TPA: DUF3500 domain-containing protein [Chloroflexota bacterium]|nr:DUF3500 domain-containing protein [Chloroflexota bacterium]